MWWKCILKLLIKCILIYLYTFSVCENVHQIYLGGFLKFIKFNKISVRYSTSLDFFYSEN